MRSAGAAGRTRSASASSRSVPSSIFRTMVGGATATAARLSVGIRGSSRDILNGTISAARRNRDTGLWEDVYAAGRSDMALVRSLRDGRRRQVAVRTLILHEEHGLSIGPCGYPDLPDMRLWRLSDPGAQSQNRTIRPRPLTTSAIPAALPCPSAPLAPAGKPEGGNGARQKTMEEGLGTKRLPHHRPPPQGTGLRPRAARALAPPDRDAPHGMGLPEEQGG